MRYLITLILCLLAGNVQAFPPGFLSTATHSYVAAGGGGVSLVDTALGASSASASSISTSDSLTVNSGDLILCLVQGGPDYPSGVTCGSNTLTKIDGFSYASYNIDAYYLAGATANSGTCTVSYASAVTYRGITCASYSGLASSDALDQYSKARITATSTITTPYNVTTTNANNLLVAIGSAWDHTQTYTGENGYTGRLSGVLNFIFDKVVSSTGTYPSGSVGTGSATDDFIFYYLAFKKAP
jgi:hypothetical protein